MLHQRIITIQTLCLIGALTGCNSEGPQPAGPDAAAEEGGPEAGPQCVGAYGNISMKAQPPPPLQMNIIDWVATGRIAASDGSSFTLDTCHPDADCVPALTTVTVSSTIPPEVDWPIGAYVTVHYLDPRGMIPTYKLSVQNVASWDGKSNPVSDSDGWYLIATDGYETHPDAPFEVAWTGVDGCPRNFAMRVRPPDGEWTTIVQGESTSIVVEDSRYHITVVRSSDQGMLYDAPPPFAWWAKSTPAE